MDKILEYTAKEPLHSIEFENLPTQLKHIYKLNQQFDNHVTVESLITTVA